MVDNGAFLADMGHEETSSLFKALQDSNAIVGDYLPHDSYLLIAERDTLASNLLKDCTVVSQQCTQRVRFQFLILPWILTVLCCFGPHLLPQAPYLPAYKVAPEWNPVLDVVASRYESNQPHPSNHWDLHDEVVSHPHISQQLRLLHPTTEKQQQHRQLLQQQHARPQDYPNRDMQEGRGDLDLPPQLLIGVDFPFLHPEDLDRQNHRLQDFHPAEAAAAEWSEHLGRLTLENALNLSLGYAEYCSPQVHVSSTTTLTVSVCPKVNRNSASPTVLIHKQLL
jgi:hypothetical protein